MLRPFAVLFGLGFLALGILGLTAHFVDSGNLFGIFRVNFEHNIAHLSSGILGILCGLYSRRASKLYFIGIGIIYAILAVVGYLNEGDMIFGMIANNQADNWLNGMIACIALYAGITKK